MEVIQPEPKHVFEFAEMANEFFEEAEGIQEWGVNQEDIHTTYFTYLNSVEHIGLLLQHEGKIVGVISGLISPYYFNYSNTIFNEFMWFVRKGYRSGGGGLKLYRVLEESCRKAGVTRIVMGHTRHKILEFETIYEKLGFNYLQTHYEKAL